MQDAHAGEAVMRPPSKQYGTLERAGRGSWWALGIALLVILAFMGLARFGTFLIPSLIGIVLATTLSPLVGWAHRWHVPRILGAAVISVFIVAGLVLLAGGIVSLVVDRSPHIWDMLKTGAGDIDRWLGKYGAARGTIDGLRSQLDAVRRGAATGVLPLALRGVHELYSLVVAIFLAAGFAFFFLWEGPDVRRWVSRHLTLPEEVGLEITASLVRTTRRYVAGLSCIGASQAVIVGATAAITGVNAWPVIAFVIFLGNYIPYIGGLIAGVFAVVLALGDNGPTAALVVLIAIVIAYFAGSHLGVFFIGGAIDLPVTAVFVLTMTGAAVAGIFGAAATAPLARLVIDARAIIRTHAGARAEGAGGSRDAECAEAAAEAVASTAPPA